MAARVRSPLFPPLAGRRGDVDKVVTACEAAGQRDPKP